MITKCIAQCEEACGGIFSFFLLYVQRMQSPPFFFQPARVDEICSDPPDNSFCPLAARVMAGPFYRLPSRLLLEKLGSVFLLLYNVKQTYLLMSLNNRAVKIKVSSEMIQAVVSFLAGLLPLLSLEKDSKLSQGLQIPL